MLFMCEPLDAFEDEAAIIRRMELEVIQAMGVPANLINEGGPVFGGAARDAQRKAHLGALA